jgi:hypothetical protein
MDGLYIKIDENGLPVDHPHLESNMRQIYPSHDFDAGPPEGWLEFERVAPPEIGAYQKFDENVGADIAVAFPHNGLEYAVVDGKVKDVWHVVDMTAEEITEKQNAVKSAWAEMLATGNFTELNDWVFDEAICGYKAPA